MYLRLIFFQLLYRQDVIHLATGSSQAIAYWNLPLPHSFFNEYLFTRFITCRERPGYGAAVRTSKTWAVAY